MMRTRPLLSLLALVLLLASCLGDSGPRVDDMTLTSAALSDNTITVVGQNFYEAGTGGMTIEACGVALPADLVAPVTQALVLPPGVKLLVQTGERLAAELPTEGLEPGASDVRVIRPDGSSVTLEGALTCVVTTDPDPEGPEEEPEDEPEEEPEEEPEDGTEDPEDDPEEEPEDDPTLGALNIRVPPAVPATITIKGPEGYTETVTTSTTLKDLTPGEYTLTVPEATEVVEQTNEGYGFSYQRIWVPAAPEIVLLVQADSTTAIDLSFSIAPFTLDITTTGLPDGYDADHWAVGIEVDQLQPDGTWTTIDLDDLPNVNPGAYRVRSEMVIRWGYEQPASYLEHYNPVNAGGLIMASSRNAVTYDLEYELQPGTISVEITGLPTGLEHTYTVQQRFFSPPHTGPMLDEPTELLPGAYYLRGPDQLNSIEIPHPAGGTTDLLHLYRVPRGDFTADSGVHKDLTLDYALEPGLLRVNISGYQGDPNAVGHVRFRRVGDTEWTSVTTQGMKFFDVEPGIFEVESLDVPAEPDVHNGYYAQSYSNGYYLVNSYGSAGANHVTIYSTYREESPAP